MSDDTDSYFVGLGVNAAKSNLVGQLLTLLVVGLLLLFGQFKILNSLAVNKNERITTILQAKHNNVIHVFIIDFGARSCQSLAVKVKLISFKGQFRVYVRSLVFEIEKF